MHNISNLTTKYREWFTVKLFSNPLANKTLQPLHASIWMVLLTPCASKVGHRGFRYLVDY